MVCSLSDDALTIIMRDTGKYFDPSRVKAPNLKAGLAQREVGGLGLYLMRKLMDEVRYQPGARGGNVLTMVKRRG